MIRRLSISALATLVIVATSDAQAISRSDSQGDLLDRAVASWAGVKTVRATFEQTITNALTGRTLTTNGEYQQDRPGKLSVTYADSAHDRIVADGKSVWLYLPSSVPGQVIKSAQGADGTGTMDISSQFLSSPRTRYDVTTAGTAVVGGRPTHAFTLVPKSRDGASFKTATVWIDDADASIRQFDVIDANSVERKVRLTSLKTNVPVDAGAFVYSPPAGVRVVVR